MPLYATIGPEEKATFGSLLENTERFQLKFYWIPNNLTPMISSNDPTRLEFKAVSDTAKSDAIIIEVAWDGEWAEERSEIQNHLVVKEVNI
ncbi:hypothetical protein ACFL4G_02710 [Thermodesulfobacteriota bacterium]